MTERFSGNSHTELVQHLSQNGTIKNERVLATMKKVDRGNYINTNPYVDGPQSIGYGVTISAPHMHAHALERLADCLVEGSRVLDVGSGTGYLTACMAIMVGRSGKTVGIDHNPELVEQSKINLTKNLLTRNLMEADLLVFVVGDGRLGYQEEGPYDVIHVGAAAADMPKPLLDQLKPGGRLIIPLGPTGKNQKLVQVDKLLDGSITKKELLGVIYGSLTTWK